ncbi:MAG: isopentenyl transferase family protein [Patescibacteria group bacterium]
MNCASNSTIKLVAIVGPTGCGKTELGQQIARQFNGVIISADSRQVYREMDIGTNKVGRVGRWRGETARWLDEVAQLLIDTVTAGERFTTSDWLTEARRLVRKIVSANQRPIIVGGTGLYVSALLDNYSLPNQAAANLTPDYLVLRPVVERARLYEIANRRIEANFDRLVEETSKLITSGVSGDWLKRIGLEYRFATEYLEQPTDKKRVIQKLCFAEHAYIRRQDTWWRHHQPVNDVGNLETAIWLVSGFFGR